MLFTGPLCCQASLPFAKILSKLPIKQTFCWIPVKSTWRYGNEGNLHEGKAHLTAHQIFVYLYVHEYQNYLLFKWC